MRTTLLFVFLIIGFSACIKIETDAEEIIIRPEMTLSNKLIYQGEVNFQDAEQKWAAKNIYSIVTRNIEKEKIEELKVINSKLKILQYVNIKLVHENDVLDLPYFDAVSEENLFWRDTLGQRVQHQIYKSYLVDIRNKQWIEIISNILALEDKYGNGPYDGIMFDDTSVLWAGSYSSIPGDYSETDEYNSFRQILQSYRKNFPDKHIHVNGYSHSREQNLTGLSLLTDSDSISFETVLHRFSGKAYETDRIIKHLEDFKCATENLGREAIFIQAGTTKDMDKRILSFAAFLLVKNDQAIYLCMF